MLDQRVVNQVRSFDKTSLSNWLANLDLTENNLYEFKAKFYSGNGNNEECRKDASALANHKGGFMFVGVDDSKNICGDSVSEINKHLDEKLRPLGNKLEWSVLKTIDLSNNKFVYIIAIEEICHYWDKPLIADSIIYVRSNGCIKTISTISDVPNAFDFKRFLPTDIRYFEELLNSRGDELERWVSTASTIPIHYARILAHCDSFLESELKNTVTQAIKDNIKIVLGLYKSWKDALNSAVTKNSTSSVLQTQDAVAQVPNNDEVRTKLKKFIEKFNKVFNYE